MSRDLSDEDRNAFNNQADRVVDALDGVEEVARENNSRSVQVTLSRGDEMAELKVLPRHRFLAKSFFGTERETFYRRDDTADFLDDLLL